MTPNLTVSGSVVRKIVDDEMKIIQTGTSTLSLKELADGWEAATEATGKLNHVRNNITSNENVTTIMFLSPRASPEEKVEMVARRDRTKRSAAWKFRRRLPSPRS